MSVDVSDLIDWATKERDDALQQIKLFGSDEVRALLVMPDGATQDITAGVLAHQTANIPMFERLILALSR